MTRNVCLHRSGHPVTGIERSWSDKRPGGSPGGWGVPVSLGNEELRSQSGHHSSGGRGEVLHLHVGREDGRGLWTSSEGPAGADWRGGRPSLHLLHIPGERIWEGC